MVYGKVGRRSTSHVCDLPCPCSPGLVGQWAGSALHGKGALAEEVRHEQHLRDCSLACLINSVTFMFLTHVVRFLTPAPTAVTSAP